MNKIKTNTSFIFALSHVDEKAFDLLFVEYYSKLLHFLIPFCKDKAEAENIIQELFMNLWIKRDRFSQIENIDSYLYITARNAALREIKQSLLRKDIKEHLEIQTDNMTGEVKLCYQELYNYITQEINKMPTQRRKIFVMSRIDGLSNTEISETLGVSKRTVEKHISLALAHLKKILPVFVVLTFFNKF